MLDFYKWVNADAQEAMHQGKTRQTTGSAACVKKKSPPCLPFGF